MNFANLTAFILSVLTFGTGFANTDETTYALGDKAQGGTVFYVNAAGTHGLAVANSDLEKTNTYEKAMESCTNESLFDIEARAYSDWKLPSNHQQDLIYDQKDFVAGLGSDSYYSQFKGYYMDFKSGKHVGGARYASHLVRCIRSF